MMTSCFPIIEFIVFTLINFRSNERKFQEGVRLRSRLRVNSHSLPMLANFIQLTQCFLGDCPSKGSSFWISYKAKFHTHQALVSKHVYVEGRRVVVLTSLKR